MITNKIVDSWLDIVSDFDKIFKEEKQWIIPSHYTYIYAKKSR